MTTRRSKRPRTSARSSKTQAKRRSVPLAAATATMRKSKLIEIPAAPASLNPVPLNPAAMFEFMDRVTSAYVELPYRLAQCRSWMDLWKEQARFARRILNLTAAPELAGSKKRKRS